MSLGIPYMGSKRKIAKPLIDYMLNSNPNAKYFYDLFGGGTSLVSAKSKGLNYIGSELDKDYYEIIQKRLQSVQGSLF